MMTIMELGRVSGWWRQKNKLTARCEWEADFLMHRVQKGQAASILIKCRERQLQLYFSMGGGAMTCLIVEKETALARSS